MVVVERSSYHINEIKHTNARLQIGIPLFWLVKLRALRPRLEADVAVDGPELRHTNEVIDMEDEVLSVSPFSTLFMGIKASYAWYYEVLDMMRRLALTCG